MTIQPMSLALAVSLICGPVCASDRTVELATVGVEDGDTLIGDIGGISARLQLAHIDAPEDSDNAKLQHDIERTGLDREVLIELGRAASLHLQGLAADRAGPFVLVYDPEHRDRYGRLVIEVSDAGGRSLGAAMVEDGFARVLPPHQLEDPRPTALTASEADAIAAGRGLWGEHSEAARAWRGSKPDR